MRYKHDMRTVPFILKSQASLTKNDFRECPLWAGYYDPDDLDEIVRWGGYSEATVRAALGRIGWEDDHYFPLPVEAVQSRWMRGKLYAASATLPDGVELDGYVGEAEDYLVVFVGDEQRVLSIAFPGLHAGLPHSNQIRNRVTGSSWTLPAV